MIKIKEKIPGSFASFKGEEIFCRIRSCISTSKKNNIKVLQRLRDAVDGKSSIIAEPEALEDFNNLQAKRILTFSAAI